LAIFEQLQSLHIPPLCTQAQTHSLFFSEIHKKFGSFFCFGVTCCVMTRLLRGENVDEFARNYFAAFVDFFANFV
jgi:hypothetical protein